MFNKGLSFVVGSGSVNPSTFVKQGPSAYQCQQASAGSVTIGIAQEGSRYAPIDGATTEAGDYTGAAGYTGDQLHVYSLGDVCLLTLGSGGATVGALLASDASGCGVVATGTQNYGAQAIEAGNSGDLVRVQVIQGVL